VRRSALALGFGLWALGVGSLAQDRPLSDTHPPGPNPHLKNEASIRAGMMMYRMRCGECHGLDAKGFRGPDLTVAISGDMTDERLFQTIRKGVPGTEMTRSRAPDDDVLMMIAYLRNLGTVAPSEAPVGNVENGRQLFNAQCSLCHRVAGRGGRLGPDLTRIGAARSRASLVREIRNPSEWIPERYETVTLVMNDGRRVRGAMKDEDAFSILVMDVSERLQGYPKSSLKEVIYDKTSLMPAYGADRLNEAQLSDLVGYLTTLREAPASATSPR
jgi:putative heme-binding domain-containing protein